MFVRDKLRRVLVQYKRDFDRWWPDEKYKWQAVQHFQQHWDINAADFLAMFKEATSKTANLLAARRFFPRRMIQKLIAADPEAVRAMFLSLFDESKDLADRIESFQSDADALREKYDDGTWYNHWQTPNTISTYLWLRYPDRYYVFNYWVYSKVVRALDSELVLRKGKPVLNLVNGFKLYDQICAELARDQELAGLLQSALDDTCYPDHSLRTLTIDVGFYISRMGLQESEWFPADYTPEISVDQWLELLANKEVFTESSLEIMKRMKDHGGVASCKQLSEKYGESPGFYNAGSSSLAMRVAKASNCPTPPESRNARWWPILYLGKYADEKEEGTFIWRLRDELSDALDRFDLSGVKLYATNAKDQSKTDYWWLVADPKVWSLKDMSVGGIQEYRYYNEEGNKRGIPQDFLDAKPGDRIIVYEAGPTKKAVALVTVAENDGKSLCVEKTDSLDNPVGLDELRASPGLANKGFLLSPPGSLNRLTKSEYDLILGLIRRGQEDALEAYSKQDFLNEVYMSEEDFDTLVSLLRRKKNLILEGPPGVGKTFTAKRLAWAIMGQKKSSNIEFIQFHQCYSYEDFVMGYKPKGERFELEHGIFYRFCQKAAAKPDEPFFFIIDEINRGNTSKIFGELLMLIEKDYRGIEITLAYDKTRFSVPENVYIIGMMNTADRSLAMIDYALRRRFSFFNMKPGFDSEGFRAYQAKLNNETFDALIERIKDLNKDITADESLGKAFCIGHSYFCDRKPEECTEEWMADVVDYEILPLLSEYWFDDEAKVIHWANRLRGVFND